MSYLKDLQYLDTEISAKQEILDEYRSTAAKYDLKPEVRQSEKEKQNMEINRVRIIELEKEINQDIDRLVAMKASAWKYINLISNPKTRLVMIKRYFQGKEFHDIASELHLGMSTVFKHHQKGLDIMSEAMVGDWNNRGGKNNFAER